MQGALLSEGPACELSYPGSQMHSMLKDIGKSFRDGFFYYYFLKIAIIFILKQSAVLNHSNLNILDGVLLTKASFGEYSKRKLFILKEFKAIIA